MINTHSLTRAARAAGRMVPELQSAACCTIRIETLPAGEVVYHVADLTRNHFATHTLASLAQVYGDLEAARMAGAAAVARLDVKD